MKNTGKKFEIEITTIITLTEQDIIDMICDGLGGDAIGYWECVPDKFIHSEEYENYKKDHSEYTCWDEIIGHMLIDGYNIPIKAYDEKEKFILTTDKFIKGIKQNSKERSWDSSYDNYDSTTIDSIIQYALFNEIIYG